MRVRFGTGLLIGLLAMVGLSATDAAAQNPRYGVTAGLNLSGISFSSEGASISPGTRAGIAFGGFLEQDLIFEGWSVLGEALVTMKGSKLQTAGEDPRVRLTYLEVPVVARAALQGPRASRLHLYAGPAFGIKISESVKPESDGGPIDGEPSAGNDDIFKPLDFSLAFGGSIEVRQIFVDLRYTLGLLNVADEDDFGSSVTARNRTFSVLVGYRLR